MNGMQHYGVGVLDGDALITMNNLAVGYFPTECPDIGVYPPPVVTQVPQPVLVPADVEQSSETSS